MSNRIHSKLSKQLSINREVVSDSELDSILEEVEKIQQNKLKVERQSLARKSAGDTSHLFTKEDEKTLKAIFNNVEKRQKEFEEMNLVRASSSCGGEVRRDSISSNSSQDSLDSQSDDELSSPVSSSAESTDSSDSNSSDDSVPNATNIKTQQAKKTPKYTRKSSMTRKSSKTEKNFPKSNIENTGKSSTVGDKTNETVKVRRRKSKIKASNTS